jgi:DNA modification methylase/transcription elongation factor Elf1
MSKQDKITCLGKEFTSEEERREYFRNELRTKLPELKKIEGFPIGEDEDIINLSDPPYYTACPNPWLNKIISEWEDEKINNLNREKEFQVNEPYTGDISVGKNHFMYKSQTYHTKVPHQAIMKFLLYYTNPGDIVYDGFSGTGMLGLAASHCGNPEPDIRHEIEREQRFLNRSCNWGVRHSINNDLSPIACFIAYNYITEHNIERFVKNIEDAIERLDKEYDWLFKTKHSNNQDGSINYVVWSDIFSCPNCNHEIIFWDALIDHEKKQINEIIECENCGLQSEKKLLNRLSSSYFDEKLNEVVSKRKRIPVLINYDYQNKSYLKKPDENDLKIINKIENTKIEYWVPTYRMPEGDECRRNDKFGVTHVHQFYTKRNLLALSFLASHLEFNEYFVLTAMLFRSTDLNMTVVSNYLADIKGKSVGGWAGRPMNGTLYLPTISTEVSVIESLKTRFKSLGKLVVFQNQYKIGRSNSIIQVGDATKSLINDNSIDYIFTDPPFGANIMYSELNFINESWLKVRTNNGNEAIENKTQNKTLFEYQNLMTLSFKENFRILKPNKWMTVEFSNTSAAVWNSIQHAITASGFIITNVAGFDKKQGTFKSNTSPTAVKQDLVITCYKPSEEFENKFKATEAGIAIYNFINDHLNHLPVHLKKENSTTAIVERSPKILFDRLVTFYLMRGLSIPIDARDFQEGLKQRFIERDGMYFTPEQAAEYDEKKAKAPQFVQLSLIVTNEADAIEWLKDRLRKQAQKYQDIMPDFRIATQSLRKGDTLPELQVILNENFIQESDGRWRTPDPNEAKDRETLRTKLLLKEFNGYVTAVNQPRAKKLKEVRVEALRAGFKNCWEQKDFKTIVTLGDMIPQNILLEDEQLLMYYDIAKDRI